MEKCEICDQELSHKNIIRINKWNGFCSDSYSINICDKCVSNIYINDYGFKFIKYKKELYIKHPINGCFENAYSQQQIDDAFNPDRANFVEWLNE